MSISNIALNDDEDSKLLIEFIVAARIPAVDSAISCQPDLPVLGISKETL